MSQQLAVYLFDHRCGTLTQDDHGQLQFAYQDTWLADPGRVALSQSLPLQSEPFRQSQCQPYFGGVLPEADQRETLAKLFGISVRNDFALLKQIGAECAGAVSILPEGEPPVSDSAAYRPISQDELAEAISRLPRRPLLASDDRVRLSLAGAQPKLALYMDDDNPSLPLDGAPSTHILKPASREYRDIVQNEAYCLDLARNIGLSAAHCRTGQAGAHEFLLVERYDRQIDSSPSAEKKVKRLHQEDFCQALGVRSEIKYQDEGGPSLADCFALIRSTSSRPAVDLLSLFDAVMFNTYIGNNDAHAKNFSLLYRREGERTVTRLAPMYDLVCTAHYPDLSRRMAMKVGGEYDALKLLGRHVARLAEDVGLSPSLALRRAVETGEKILITVANHGIPQSQQSIAATVQQRTETVLARFKHSPTAS